MFFGKRKQVHKEEFYISNENVEYVDQFTYLGTGDLGAIFSHTGNMSLAVKVLQEQALRAYYNSLSLFDRVQLDIKTKRSLFDKMIAPIILYRGEVGGGGSTILRKWTNCT